MAFEGCNFVTRQAHKSGGRNCHSSHCLEGEYVKTFLLSDAEVTRFNQFHLTPRRMSTIAFKSFAEMVGVMLNFESLADSNQIELPYVNSSKNSRRISVPVVYSQ